MATAGPRNLRQVVPPPVTSSSGASAAFQRMRGTDSAAESAIPAREVAVLMASSAKVKAVLALRPPPGGRCESTRIVVSAQRTPITAQAARSP